MKFNGNLCVNLIFTYIVLLFWFHLKYLFDFLHHVIGYLAILSYALPNMFRFPLIVYFYNKPRFIVFWDWPRGQSHKVPTGQESSNDCSSVPWLLVKEVKVGGSCETQSQWEQTVHVSISKELTKSWWWVPHDAKRVCSINTKKSIIKHTCSFRSSSSALLKKPCFAI